MAQDYYQQGLAKAKAGDKRGAIADFELALIATPEWAEVYYRRGLAYFDLGEILTAVSDYTQALNIETATTTDFSRTVLYSTIRTSRTGRSSRSDR
jgi:tetratricopeptide (TPR) repeat protein